MLRRLSALAGVGSGAGIAVYGYDDWREKEMVKLKLFCEELQEQGYLKLPSSVSARDKRISWENILRRKMLKLFSEKYSEFDLVKQIWPEPMSGKNYQFTLRDNHVGGMPHIFRNNYLVQAILCYFCSPDLQLVHYGDQTCIRLKFLISPTWAFASLISPKSNGGESSKNIFGKWGAPPTGMFEFRGDDQSWHITNLPNRKFGSKGKQLPWASHFDAGVENIFTKGIPNALLVHPNTKTNLSSTDAEQTLLRMALHQLAIIFYCDTPGSLTPERGATGFYPGSHLIVNRSIKDVLVEKNQLSWWSMGFSLRQVFREDGPIPGIKGRPAIVQPVLQEDEILLALGTLVHSSMFATELMEEQQPRVIQNCKVSAADFCMTRRKGVSVTECSRRQNMQDEFLGRISKDSHLYKTFALARPSPSSRVIVDEYSSHFSAEASKKRSRTATDK